MADPDPESEALIRQLHRELNGLTRRARNPPLARKVLHSKKSLDSRTASEDLSEKGTGSRPTSEEGAQAAEQRPKIKKERDGSDRPLKVARRSNSAPTAAAAQGDTKGQTATKAPVGVPPTAPVVPLSPIEEAAALAATLTVSKVKQTGHKAAPTQSPGPRLIKCFHAGIRWGVTLSAESIRHRSDLATALNDAYAGQILSCGRGEMLHVVFLDQAGQAVEFPALRSDIKESASQWRACVDKAVRVYVMR